MTEQHDSLAMEYERNGYVVVRNLLNDKELTTIRQHIADVAAGRVPEFPNEDLEFEPRSNPSAPPAIRKINRCAQNDAVFMRLACNEKVLDIVEQLIGPNIKLYGSQCFMKPPGGVAKPWHQDSAYFTIEPRSLVTCWTALDEVTVENGCVWVVPGSHTGELHDHDQPWQVGDRTDMQVPDAVIGDRAEAPIVMPAGSCSFHHSMLLHRSGPNLTDTSRRGLAIHYMPAEARWTHPTQAAPEFALLRGSAFSGCV